jgi:hypothetical protein
VIYIHNGRVLLMTFFWRVGDSFWILDFEFWIGVVLR